MDGEQLDMKTVQSQEELKANIAVIKKYLNYKTDPTYDFALNLIKKGVCFVVEQTPDGLKFYPSRFIGYQNNSMDAHLSNMGKDGRETNPAISWLFGSKPLPNPELDKLYRVYCESLGFIAREKGAFGVERKYWGVII